MMLDFAQIRNSAHKTIVRGPLPPNPFAQQSWKRNVVELLCRPEGSSWLNGTGIATVDKREANPGSVSEEDVRSSWEQEGEETPNREGRQEVPQ
jgi:palmitoyltransferase ZDHHC9/14/18